MNRPGKFAPISKRLKPRTPSVEVERSIIDAAEELLVTSGPDALTVRAIASAAGVAPMGVYNHLGGKDGVLDALLRRGFDGLTAAITDVRSDDTFEDLAEAGRRYRQFARDNPSHYALMFERNHDDFEPSAMTLERAFASFKAFEALVQRAMDAHSIAPGVAADVAQSLWSACHGSSSLELRGISFCENTRENQEATTYAMLRGLRDVPEA